VLLQLNSRADVAFAQAAFAARITQEGGADVPATWASAW
jgi:hypothetical protein